MAAKTNKQTNKFSFRQNSQWPIGKYQVDNENDQKYTIFFLSATCFLFMVHFLIQKFPLYFFF